MPTLTLPNPLPHPSPDIIPPLSKGEPQPAQDYLTALRESIRSQYRGKPGDGSFGEILCYEIHTGGLTFCWLAEKWGISLPMLGELIWDHCKRLEEMPRVDHEYRIGA